MSFGRRPRRGHGSLSGEGNDAVDVDGPDEDPAVTARRAYATAIKLLGARDHSSHELTRKLGDRDVPAEIIESVLVELRESNYVDDRRYATTYVEQRIARGYGPRAIESKLRERGIDGALVREAFETVRRDGAADADDADDTPPDWVTRATEALARKFRDDQLLDTEPKATARLARFLQSRGFSPGDSLRAIDRARARALAVADEPLG